MVTDRIANIDVQILDYIIQNYIELCKKYGAESDKDITEIIRETYSELGTSTIKDAHKFYHFLNDAAEEVKLQPSDFDKLVRIAFESIKKMKSMKHGEEMSLENLALVIDELNKNKKSLVREDRYTAGHSERVGIYSMEIGSEMGLPNVHELYTMGMFHDIGKLLGDKRILIKEGPLTPEEYEKMKMHPTLGYRFMEITGQGAFSQEILDGVLYHHVYFNKSVRGYPEIGDKEIPLYARIAAVADSYDAMKAKRPYRARLPMVKIASELYKNREVQFDPQILDAFLETKTKLKMVYNDVKQGNIQLW